MRHSSAGSVVVTLTDGETLVLRVADDGRGFGGDGEVPDGDGFGLVSMRERAQLAGGTLVVRSRAGRTVVEAQIPR